MTSCRECGKPLGPSVRPEKKFCCHPCGFAWNNRRKLRGAELYDLFMAMRYERGAAKLYGVWAIICRMAAMWNEEDKERGAKSYAPIKEVMERYVHYTAVRNTVRIGKRSQ